MGRPGKVEDGRIQKSKKAVLAATYELLTEAGLGGFTVDAVSARSGVAKTTIYRHWPSRSALVLDACSQLSPRREAPETGSVKGDLRALLTDLAQRLRTARWPGVLPSIIDAAERDAEIAAVYARLHREMMNAFRLALERAREKGELPTSTDIPQAMAALVGPIFYRRWFSREPIDDRFIKAVCETVLHNYVNK